MEDASTTIGKYITRFRRERPRPRAQRTDVRLEDFWWVRPGSQGEGEEPRTMDWEVELLSQVASTQPSEAAASMQSSVPAAASSALHESHFAYRPRDVTEGQAFDEEFVLLTPRSTTPVHGGEMETLSYEDASLEDPEIVIQRIRRRLGFEPHARLSSLPVFDDAPDTLEQPPLYSPLHDEQLHMAELSLSGLKPPASSHELPPCGLHSPISSLPSLILDGTSSGISEAKASVDMSNDSKSHPGDTILGVEGIVPEEPDRVGDVVIQQEADPLVSSENSVSQSEEPLSFVTSSNEEVINDSATMLNGGIVHDFTMMSNEEVVNELTVADPFEEKKEDDAMTLSQNESVVNEEPPLQASLQSDRGDETAVLKTPSPSPKLTYENDNEDTPKRKIKRLPPLSPARSPLVRPSLPPRSASVDSEIPVETAQTLDSLLSFVVHAWGDEVPEAESNSASDVPSTDTLSIEAELEDTSSLSQDAHNDHTLTAAGEQDSLVSVDLDLVASYSDDPVVSLLQQRIVAFEKALKILEERESESAQLSQQDEDTRSI